MNTGYLISYHKPNLHKRVIYTKPGSSKSCFDKKDADKIADKLVQLYGKRAHPRIKKDARCDITAW